MSDNATSVHPRHNFYAQIRAGKHIATVNPDNYGYRGWNFVRAINIGLANYGKAKVTDAIRNRYVGEARLFRGWFYADKVSKYGDVPYIEKELNTESEELFAARTPRVQAMDKIFDDLAFAAKNLPDSWGDGGAPGRLNRWCALLVQARVCLFEGTWRKYHGIPGGQKFLETAAAASKELIEKGPYKIFTTGNPNKDYNSYMQALNLSGNPEVMYWRKYTLGVITNHVQSYFEYHGGATRDFVEDYLCTDGLPISLSKLYKGDGKIEDSFSPVLSPFIFFIPRISLCFLCLSLVDLDLDNVFVLKTLSFLIFFFSCPFSPESTIASQILSLHSSLIFTIMTSACSGVSA